MHRHSMLSGAAMMALAGLAMERPDLSHGYGRAPARAKWRRPFDVPPTNGKREVGRRLRQIERGQLQVTPA